MIKALTKKQFGNEVILKYCFALLFVLFDIELYFMLLFSDKESTDFNNSRPELVFFFFKDFVKSLYDMAGHTIAV